MEAVLQKIGSDLGINIPSVITKELSLREGLYVNIYGNGNRIIIDTVKPDVSYNLTDMVEQISENNIHQCIDTGANSLDIPPQQTKLRESANKDVRKFKAIPSKYLFDTRDFKFNRDEANDYD